MVCFFVAETFLSCCFGSISNQEKEKLFNKNNDSCHYKTLNVSKTSSKQEIKKAYRGLMKKYHPDKLSSSDILEKKEFEEMAKRINEAYQTLIKI
jgi:DnaJ like chaperone protein